MKALRFLTLAAGALGPDVALPSIVSTVGLILFIYSIGIQFGPTFVNPFGREGYRIHLFCIGMLAFGAAIGMHPDIFKEVLSEIFRPDTAKSMAAGFEIPVRETGADIGGVDATDDTASPGGTGGQGGAGGGGTGGAAGAGIDASTD